MKTAIVNSYLILSALLQISSLIMQPSLTTLYGSSLSIIVCIASIIAIIGYIKKSSWSKILSFIIIGFQAILTICTGVYLALFTALGVSVLIPYLSFGLPLLFLAFKIYTSKPLASYMSNA